MNFLELDSGRIINMDLVTQVVPRSKDIGPGLEFCFSETEQAVNSIFITENDFVRLRNRILLSSAFASRRDPGTA